ncbi:nucleoside hydrolase [Paractinoplanes durhamensis]|uniref:nucleoside hydrolase n=1 Tax=Paractinoplanes durhamensis TaxID=113563 RepID=UPI0036388434
MKLYLDCDTGIDDAVALGFLLGSPDVQIVGIGTVNGNTSAVQAARNTLGLLELSDISDIPVAVGAGAYRGGAGDVHGGNGIGEVSLPPGGAPDPRTSASLLWDLARDNPGTLHILATGPCGNLASALRLFPSLPSLIASVTVMGGAVRVPGNVTPRSEANIHDDPTAAAAVLAAPWPVTLVPLDVTMRHRWTEDDRAALHDGGTPLQQTLADMLPTYFDFYEPRLGVREIPLHDPGRGDRGRCDSSGGRPQLPLRVDLEGAVREDPAAVSSVRTVLALDQPAAPIILRRILGIRS